MRIGAMGLFWGNAGWCARELPKGHTSSQYKHFSLMAKPLFFSTFEVTRQAFHRTALAYAIVNLKPIVPGRTCSPAHPTIPTFTQSTSLLSFPPRCARMLDAPRPASHGPAHGRALRAHACHPARRTSRRARIQGRRTHHCVSGTAFFF
jgi:hypothetical protein